MWPTLRLEYSAYSAPYGRPRTWDRLTVIVCSPGRADQIRSSKCPDSPVAIITVLPDRISSPTVLVARSAVRPRSPLGSPSMLTSRSTSFSMSTNPPASALVSSRRLMADADPADGLARAVDQAAGVDAQVKQAAVLADPAGGERDLAAGGDVLEDRVVLGLQLF